MHVCRRIHVYKSYILSIVKLNILRLKYRYSKKNGVLIWPKVHDDMQFYKTKNVYTFIRER